VRFRDTASSIRCFQNRENDDKASHRQSLLKDSVYRTLVEKKIMYTLFILLTLLVIVVMNYLDSHELQAGTKTPPARGKFPKI
jgi:cell division protein FtsL